MTRFRLMSATTVLVAATSFYGCSESSDDCTPGSEGCQCNEGQCLSGLVCLSNTCVDDGGLCEGVDCTSTNECVQDGTCDPDTGMCDAGGNVDDGTPCDASGAPGQCQSGACEEVPCDSDDDCSSTSECIADGTCNVQAGMCVPGANKDEGTECSENGGSFCDGSGDCIECNDAGQCPDDGNECTASACAGGACSVNPEPVGTECNQGGGSYCDGEGTCVECNEYIDCMHDGNECSVATCEDNECGSENAVDGTECDLLDVGDGICDDGECVRSNVVVGAFDTGRGGILSFAESSSLSQIRNEILTALPEVTFVTTDALTTAFLDTVDVLMISSGYQGNAAITPLTASEQAALRAFVESGGGALLFADNDSFGGAGSDPANESLIDAFGLDVTGTLEPGLTVTVINPSSSPITDGPFGLVTSVRYWSTGYFDNLGPEAQSLATLNVNGEPGLALIPRDTLAPGSGDVLLFSDMTLVVNSWITPANVVLVKNALHHVARLAE